MCEDDEKVSRASSVSGDGVTMNPSINSTIGSGINPGLNPGASPGINASARSFDLVIVRATTFLTSAVLLILACIVFAVLVYLLIQWWKHRDREDYSLRFVHLLIALPKDNEIKIDAAEQMFAGLHALKKEGFFAFLKSEDHFAFEIVALHEDIRFYVTCPANLRDFIEKQINGAYPGAEISEVDEPNIFSEGGKVAFAALRLKDQTYFPMKTYKDLPTDSLSLVTSAMSRMQLGAGAFFR